VSKPLRSQPTRDRILATARAIFGEECYDRTTIRAVAAAANINPSMVMRYYGSKEGLFAAAVNFDLQLPDLSAVPRDEIGRTLVRHALRRWSAAGGELPALLRIAVTHETARDRLQSILQEQVAPALARICAPDRAGTCAALVASQMLGLALTRYVLRLPIVTSLSDRTLIDEIGPKIQAYIEGTSGTRSG
jgi:AcrR family transcriptional regulator